MASLEELDDSVWTVRSVSCAIYAVVKVVMNCLLDVDLQSRGVLEILRWQKPFEMICVNGLHSQAPAKRPAGNVSSLVTVRAWHAYCTILVLDWWQLHSGQTTVKSDRNDNERPAV